MGAKRSKIDDVVKLTGLSRATIDRVVNSRPGVRAETKVRVDAALLELGFAPDAMTLRKVVQPKVVSVLLSRGTNPFFAELRKGIEQYIGELREQNVKVHFGGFDPYRPETVVERLRKVPSGTTSVVMVGVDAPEVESAIDELSDKGIRVVTIVSDVPRSKRVAYVGQDNFAAGNTAGKLMCQIAGIGEGEIAILIGHVQFRHLLDRQSGFQQTLALRRPDLTVIQTKPYGTEPWRARDIVKTLREQHPQLKGIYLCGGGQPHLIEEFTSWPSSKPVVIGHEVTVDSRSALASGTYNLVVAHDVLELGRKTINFAIDRPSFETPFCGINIFVSENLPPKIS